MLDGKFDDAKDAIGVFKNTKNGKTFISEGNHRIQAAKEIYEESGDISHINKLLKNARTTEVTTNPVGHSPLNKVGK